MTSRTSPTAESTAPQEVEGPGRICRQRVDEPAAQDDYRRDDDRLEDEGRSPADRRRDQTTDQRSRRGADAPHRADRAERASTRSDLGEQQRREDIDRRDQHRGAHAFEDRVADDAGHPDRERPR